MVGGIVEHRGTFHGKQQVYGVVNTMLGILKDRAPSSRVVVISMHMQLYTFYVANVSETMWYTVWIMILETRSIHPRRHHQHQRQHHYLER